ncbi:DJ-1/PfpI family protein [Bordetella sp. 2513F-2]
MKNPGYRLGIYVYHDAEVMDISVPFGVFATARRYEPELGVFLVGDTRAPVHAGSAFSVTPRYGLDDHPALDAFLMPGGAGARDELHNRRLHDYVRALSGHCLLAGLGSGAWLYGRMGLLDGLPATSRKEPDRLEASHLGQSPLDRLSGLAPGCRPSRARVVDAGRVVTAGGAAAGLDLGLHLLRRAGLPDETIDDVVRVLEYQHAYAHYREDIEYAAGRTGSPSLPA